jgi:hypothetical protein
VVFTVAVLAMGAEIVFARAYGAREGGAPLVVLAMVVTVVIVLDAVARGGVAAIRRLILRSGLRRQ